MKNIIQLHEITPSELQSYIVHGIKENLKEFLPDSGSEKHHPLLTRKEACKILSISLPTLHDWVKRGMIKSYRIGNRVYFKHADIEQSLKQIKY